MKSLCRRKCSGQFDKEMVRRSASAGRFLCVEIQRDLCYYNIWDVLPYLLRKENMFMNDIAFISNDVDKRINKHKYGNYLYHYTSIATLHNILKSKQFGL